VLDGEAPGVGSEDAAMLGLATPHAAVPTAMSVTTMLARARP